MKSLQVKEIQAGVITIENFLTVKECKNWITFCEERGFETASLSIGRTRQLLNPTIRNNERLIYDSPELANDLWQKLEPYSVKKFGKTVAIGLNERFRFYKYLPGHRFRTHQDRSFIRSTQEWSSFTFMIYLNEEMKGGSTKFSYFEVKPKTGMAFIFPHQLSHSGEEVLSGVKYVLRSDVMYRKTEI